MMDERPNLLAEAAESGANKYSWPAFGSFVCGNLTLVGLLFGKVLPGVVYLFVAFVPGVLLGHLARRAFVKEPGAYRNESMARYGLAVAYLGLFLSVFVVLAMVFL